MKKNKNKIKINKHNARSLDELLTPIILKGLRKYRVYQQGSLPPVVDNSDLPDDLKWVKASNNAKEALTDNQARWDWVLEQMIIAFELVQNTGLEYYNHRGEFDSARYRAACAKISNGLRLFARYYRNLCYFD